MKLLLFALKILPGVLAAVKGVEEAIGAGNGKTKRDMVIDVIKAAGTGAAGIEEEHVQVVGQVIDAVVGTLNASGIFKKGV